MPSVRPYARRVSILSGVPSIFQVLAPPALRYALRSSGERYVVSAARALADPTTVTPPFALDASDVCLVGENPTCSVPAL